jgi:hypothetical protein
VSTLRTGCEHEAGDELAFYASPGLLTAVKVPELNARTASAEYILQVVLGVDAARAQCVPLRRRAPPGSARTAARPTGGGGWTASASSILDPSSNDARLTVAWLPTADTWRS